MDVIWQFIKDNAAAISAVAAIATVLLTLLGIFIARRKKEDARPFPGVRGKKLKSGGKFTATDGTGRGVDMEGVESANDMDLSSVSSPEERNPKG